MIFLLLPNNTYQWRFRVQHRTIKVAANNGSHCTLAARPLPSQQRQAPERACITFSQISNHIYDQLIKMLEFFSSRFMLYNLDMRPLQGNHNMFCDIHIFLQQQQKCYISASKSWQLPNAQATCKQSFALFFLCKENFVWLFHAKIKFCVFFCGTMCVIIFFRCSVSATKISMKVLRIETK